MYNDYKLHPSMQGVWTICQVLRPLLIGKNYYYCFMWLCSPARAKAFSFTRFRDHTRRRATIGRLLWTSDQLVAETST
jgi:hypothetical protein